MIRLRIMSDLHLEFRPMDLEPIGEDVLVLAGDIGIGAQGARWGAEYARRHGISVIMVAGNHEYYSGSSQRTMSQIHAEICALESLADFSLLDNTIAAAGGTTFIGCTLWTDYALDGQRVVAKLAAQQSITDHHAIWRYRDVLLSPSHAAKLHAESVAWLQSTLPQMPKPLIVVTHHLPSRRSIAPQYAGDPLNASFASNLDELVTGSGAALWIHGHAHASADYYIGDTRVICNPRGYNQHENPEFNPNLLIEV